MKTGRVKLKKQMFLEVQQYVNIIHTSQTKKGQLKHIC